MDCTAMSETLVERMARAMADVNNNSVGLSYNELLGAMALAALRAIREPTDAMKAAGRDVIEPYVQLGLSKSVADQWQIARETFTAEIDAAIAEAEAGAQE